MDFRKFLLNENNQYLGEKIGEILEILHRWQEDKNGLDARDEIEIANKVVDSINAILKDEIHKKTNSKIVEKLQDAGVAISRSIDGGKEGGEEEEEGEEGENVLPVLSDVLYMASDAFEDFQKELGSPIHDLGTPADASAPKDAQRSLSPPIKPEKAPPKPMDQTPQDSPQDSPQGSQGSQGGEAVPQEPLDAPVQ